MMPEITINLPRPHPKQAPILANPARRTVIASGRRSGKTTLAAWVACHKLIEGRRVLLASTTQEQADSFWDIAKTWLHDVIEAGVIVKNEQRRILTMPATGGRVKVKTAWDADSLRGDYADFLVLDECALLAEDAWQKVGAPMLLDNDGDAWFLSTPRRHNWFYKLYQKACDDTTGRWKAWHFTSYDNPHVSRDALDALTSDMTRESIKQEIEADFLDAVQGALWTQQLLDDTRVSQVPDMRRIVVGVDPSATGTGDTCGIVVCGKGVDGHGYVLDDRTLQASPSKWAHEAVAAYHRHKADRLVAESNNGGEMVSVTIHTIEGAPPVALVHASRGKITRAEPIAALFEQQRCHMVGTFGALEDELTSYDGTGASPGRLDAMVWACTELRIGGGIGVY